MVSTHSPTNAKEKIVFDFNSHEAFFENVTNSQDNFLNSKTADERKKLGQFFTGEAIAKYMASLITLPEQKTVRLLDAGAGVGILTLATALRCLELGCEDVHAVLYEIDKQSISILDAHLQLLQQIFVGHGATFSYEIRIQDFILARPDQEINSKAFDISIINPPYFKYNVESSPYANATADLFKGNPNIYASFISVVIACLKNQGQMVSISPRSFTNGLYFKGFRDYLLSQAALETIHIFKSRDKVFNEKSTSVLQESIICKFVKNRKLSNVEVRTSDCADSISATNRNIYQGHLIIDSSNNEKFVRIPESQKEASILMQAEQLPTTFEEAGYFISTGPVVEHRTREYITENNQSEEAVPLYRPHNVVAPLCKWDGNHKKDVSFMLAAKHGKHTLKNKTYVLLKRFSSKDEKRRLYCGIYFSQHHNCAHIGFGNKLNYIGISDEELESDEAYGLAAIFNSTFMDSYFRCISGNTQVNATEIRKLKFPSRQQIKSMGQRVKKLNGFSTSSIDEVFEDVIKGIHIG